MIFSFSFLFFKRDPKVRGGGAGKEKGRGEKGKKPTLTLTLTLPYFDASTSRSIESPNLSHSRKEGGYSALKIQLKVNFNQ